MQNHRNQVEGQYNKTFENIQLKLFNRFNSRIEQNYVPEQLGILDAPLKSILSPVASK